MITYNKGEGIHPACPPFGWNGEHKKYRPKPGRSIILPAGWGWKHDAFCLLKGRFIMKNIDHLTDEELRELLSKPLSKETAKQFLELDRSSRWLLALNLREMGKQMKKKARSNKTT
jgi:hypothetical protein